MLEFTRFTPMFGSCHKAASMLRQCCVNAASMRQCLRQCCVNACVNESMCLRQWKSIEAGELERIVTLATRGFWGRKKTLMKMFLIISNNSEVPQKLMRKFIIFCSDWQLKHRYWSEPPHCAAPCATPCATCALPAQTLRTVNVLRKLSG